MWTIEDNSKDINWHEANQYAKGWAVIPIGGYPPSGAFSCCNGHVFQIAQPLSTKEGSDSAWYFDFQLRQALTLLLV
jgi:hypothetical protein